MSKYSDWTSYRFGIKRDFEDDNINSENIIIYHTISIDTNISSNNFSKINYKIYMYSGLVSSKIYNLFHGKEYETQEEAKNEIDKYLKLMVFE